MERYNNRRKAEFEKSKNEMEKVIQTEIIQVIKNNNIRNKSELVSRLTYEESLIHSQIKVLSMSKKISYDNSKKIWLLNK